MTDDVFSLTAAVTSDVPVFYESTEAPSDSPTEPTADAAPFDPVDAPTVAAVDAFEFGVADEEAAPLPQEPVTAEHVLLQ